MSKQKRFYIDCYGICDTWKGDVDALYCSEKKLTWQELCNTLNSLYENVDTDKQVLLLEIEELKKENCDLRRKLEDIHFRIGMMMKELEDKECCNYG